MNFGSTGVKKVAKSCSCGADMLLSWQLGSCMAWLGWLGKVQLGWAEEVSTRERGPGSGLLGLSPCSMGKTQERKRGTGAPTSSYWFGL